MQAGHPKGPLPTLRSRTGIDTREDLHWRKETSFCSISDAFDGLNHFQWFDQRREPSGTQDNNLYFALFAYRDPAVL
jgi:hypothetical protein